MKNQARRAVVIVGGGIAGLAAAYRLRKTAPTTITLVERDARLGGKILTECIDGFVVEGGPDSFLASKPAGLELCRNLGLEDRLEGTRLDSRGAFIVRGRKLHPLPEGLSGLVPGRLAPLFRSDLLSPWGKLRFAAEYWIPPRGEAVDEPLASFMRRRFGAEVYERLMDPLMTGIFAGDGEELSLQATFPQLARLERQYGSVLKGLRANAGGQSQKGSRAGFLTPIGGMGEIVEALESALGGIRLITGREARAVRRAQAGYDVSLAGGETLFADAVILATPAFVSAGLLSELDADLADELAGIPYVSTATVSLAFPRLAVPRMLTGTGWLAPRAEGGPVTALTWVSSKFAHRAPEDFVLLRAFIGRAGQEGPLSAPDAGLLSLVRREIAEVHAITAEPALQRIFRWTQAMPQYTMGHLDRLDRIANRLQSFPGLTLAGSAYRGVGIPDCISSGEAAADRVIASAARGPVPSAP